MESRKQKIIDTARELFAQKGFSATGLREIAEVSGVSLGNIYNYFKNKEELFTSIFKAREIAGSLADTFVEIAEEFPYNIDSVILLVKKAVDENMDLYRLTHIDLIEFDGKNTNTMLQYFIDFGQSFFRERLVIEAEKGNLREIDFDFFSRFLVISLITFFTSSRVLPALNIDHYSDAEMSKVIANVILRGIENK